MAVFFSMEVLDQLWTSALCVVVSAALIPLLHIPIMRLRRNHVQEMLLWMIASWAVSFVAWHVLFLWIERSYPLHINAFVEAYALLGFLWLGYLEMMFKLYRGLSHTIVTDIERTQPVTLETIMRDFAQGTGAEEMLNRRLRAMQISGLIRIEHDRLILTGKGERAARMTSALKSFLKLGSCG
ncbi:MAG TPA: hypothetical protein VHA78_00455 [Candidatus Peribacteraceae bacterium]|nr:hypothetical protein [Candidatus Peribacteraceae bacterium]